MASSAVDWCKQAGGSVKQDLIWKFSKMAASGRHPQNAERDLQTTIKKYGKTLDSVRIDKIPVRLYNPTTEEIYTAELPILDPASVAEAIWQQSPGLFETVFLGCEGRSGAREFWLNAKQNADWFRQNCIPEQDYDGLVPLYLYGDDVQAYKNSDPGAISCIGWGFDFGYKNECMLQAFLLCVYSEYMSCEHTHQDVVDYVMERFKFMADRHAGHVWSGKFRFLFAGCRGDLKWLNESRRVYWHSFEAPLQEPTHPVYDTGIEITTT